MKHYTAISIPDSPQQPWRSLHVFNLYRLTVAGAIAVIFFLAPPGDTVLGAALPTVFAYAVVLWVLASLAGGFASRWRTPHFQWQTTLTILLDIGFISVLMYASGGIGSGIGTLMLVTIAAGGILVSGKQSFTFAALAVLCALSIHGGAILFGHRGSEYGFTHIGLLGAGLFAVALLTHTLALRTRESESLATQRGAALANLSQINELIIQQMDIGLLVLTDDGFILLQNDAALDMLGADHDLSGRYLADISPKLHAQLLSWQKNADTGAPLRIETSAREILPRFSHISETAAVTIAVFLEDTAQLAQQMQQIKLAALGRLTASIAHEIRNPLSAINHANQLLAESNDLAQHNLRLTEIINAQSHRLNTVVENILSLSRKDKYAKESINVCDWLERFVGRYSEELSLANSDIVVGLEDCSTLVQFDPTHLEQIFYNLCDNALRHSSSASHEPRVRIEGKRAASSNTFIINVTDNGDGVQQNNREKLFEPFFTTNPEGTGLGLFIARELTQLNNARLNYIDAQSGGACFLLSIPVAPA